LTPRFRQQLEPGEVRWLRSTGSGPVSQTDVQSV